MHEWLSVCSRVKPYFVLLDSTLFHGSAEHTDNQLCMTEPQPPFLN